MPMHKVKIFNNNGKIVPPKIEIDDKPLMAYSVDYHADISSVPVFCFEIASLADIEVNHANIMFRLHPETVEEAAAVLRKELLRKGDLYKALMASISSALDKYQDEQGCMDDGYYSDYLAELVMERLVGVDDKVT